MIPTHYIQDSLSQYLASAVGLLGGAVNGATVHLTKATFAPSLNLLAADLIPIECDFAGYAPLAGGATPSLWHVDTANQRRLVSLVDPVGGWKWTPSGTLSTRQTAFGIYVTDVSNVVLMGSMLLDAPYEFTDQYAPLIIGTIDFLFPTQFIL